MLPLLDEIITRINESNKYFMGVKLNTNYLKVHNQVKFADILKEKVEKVNISELPIQISKE